MDHVKRVLGMQPHRDARELRDEWARHWDVGLRSIDRIGPVNRHRAFAIARLTTPPVLFSHVHPERRPHLLGVGDNVDLVPAGGKRMRGPIGAHADAALDGRKFADEADSHRRTSTSPRAVRSARSLAKSGSASSPCGSVQSLSAASRSKIAGMTSNTCGSSAPGGMATTSGVSPFTGTAPSPTLLPGSAGVPPALPITATPVPVARSNAGETPALPGGTVGRGASNIGRMS